MLYRDYIGQLRERHRGLPWEHYGSVVENGDAFPLLMYNSSSYRCDVMVTAGFHGNEPAGPMTILEYASEMVGYAISAGVDVSIFPCVNPSGFEDNTRYNRSGQKPNNAFLEYEIRPGVWLGVLPPGFEFRRTRTFSPMTQETQLLYDHLRHIEVPPVGIVDLHQDGEWTGNKTYAYVFGDRSLYIPVQREVIKHAEPVVRSVIDTGPYGYCRISTDDWGLTEFHDGSIIDYFWRRGTDYAVTVETTASTPFEISTKIGLIWVKGVIDLVARNKYANS